MQEILYFKVFNANAEYNNGSLKVNLFYPEKPIAIDKRLPANLEFGIGVLERLIRTGYSKIADSNHPVHPAGGGSLIIFEDDNFACHRRGKFAPVHKNYFSAYSGYPNSHNALYTKEGFLESCLRETAEECLLITKESNPRLVVTKSLKQHSLETAKRLGMDIPTIEVSEKLLEPKDKLEVYDNSGNEIFSVNGFADVMYDAATSVNMLQLRQLGISSEEIYPIDAEGMIKDSKFVHFNRESFLIHPSKIESLKFGYPLENQIAYKTNFKNGKPEVYPYYPEEKLGPGATPVTHSFLWAPENLLCNCLDGLGVKGFAGNKLQIELWKEKTILTDKNRSESSLIPEQYKV